MKTHHRKDNTPSGHKTLSSRALFLRLGAALTLTGIAMVMLIAVPANASVPCHECDGIYDPCITDANQDYNACISEVTNDFWPPSGYICLIPETGELDEYCVQTQQERIQECDDDLNNAGLACSILEANCWSDCIECVDDEGS